MAVQTRLASPSERQAFYRAHEADAQLLLKDLATEWHADNDLWHDLGFAGKGPATAVEWCVEQWCRADWSFAATKLKSEPGRPSRGETAMLSGAIADMWFGPLGLRLEIFGLRAAWILLRFADLEARDFERGRRPKKETADERPTLSDPEESSSQSEKQVAACYFRHRWDPAEDNGSLLTYVAGLESTLDRFGRATHRGLEVLWFGHHDDLADFLAEAAESMGCRWDAPTDDALPSVCAAASPPSRSKTRVLAAFRFLVFRDQVAEPDTDADLATAAFVATYLSRLEKPDWPQQPKDRWDIVPKRVVAERIRRRFREAASNVVAAEAGAKLAELAEEAMVRYSRQARRLQSDEFEQVADLVHARGAITSTLRCEFPRTEPDAGPSAEQIERWRGEIKGYLQRRREDAP